MIEQLLRKIERLTVPDNWRDLTPAELHLDSLDMVEMQLELESACEVTLFDDDVSQSPLTRLTMAGLAAHVDALRKNEAASG